ncbi:hypothetical protein NC652_037216 [Populus alba x Populus x berolinensis]|nr:hypothetical protein NC652_037216 [Populus alba x Populus x berolinensis]
MEELAIAMPRRPLKLVSETDLLSLKHGNPGKQLLFSVPFRWGSLRVGIIGIANAQDGVLCNGWLSSVQTEVERERERERE